MDFRKSYSAEGSSSALQREAAEALSSATRAAVAGAPVVERSVPIWLPDVASWPRPDLVILPPGSFFMGANQDEDGASNRERRQRLATIPDAIAFGRDPVTFAEWDCAREAGATLHNPNDHGWGRADRPVVDVSWDDALRYIAWLNDRSGLVGAADAYRLPTEAEWEYACRAGSSTAFSFGDSISIEQANFDGRFGYAQEVGGGLFRGCVTPVGAFPANAFGLRDMHGNVWEWCDDLWHEWGRGERNGPAVRGPGRSGARVIRGGSWNDIPQFLRSANRDGLNQTARQPTVGFRVARSLPAIPAE